jgi:hypothetical protein
VRLLKLGAGEMVGEVALGYKEPDVVEEDHPGEEARNVLVAAKAEQVCGTGNLKAISPRHQHRGKVRCPWTTHNSALPVFLRSRVTRRYAGDLH